MNHSTGILLLIAIGGAGCSAPAAGGSNEPRPLSLESDDGCAAPERFSAPTVTRLAGPLESSVPRAIVSAHDGAWFTDSQDVTLSHLGPDGALLRFPAPFPSEEVFDAALDGDGNVWFDSLSADRVRRLGRMTPDGETTLFDIPSAERARRLAPDSDGAVWFTAGESIGRVTRDGIVEEIAVGAVTGDITSGTNGSIWFTEPNDDRIGRLAPDGTVTHIDVPTPDSGLHAIALGPDGHVWFTETKTGQIGRIDGAGSIRELPVVSPPESVRELVAGPDARLWFTLDTAAFRPTRVGSISTCGAVATVDLPEVEDPMDYQPALSVPAVPYGIAGGASEVWVTARLEPFETGAVFRLDLGNTLE